MKENKSLNDGEVATTEKSLAPWLNEDGSEKSEQELRELSKNWSPETWDAYLQTVEIEAQEEMFDEDTDFNELSEEDCINFIYTILETPDYQHLETALHACLKSLPNTQYRVIHEMYWNRLSERQVAKQLSISKGTVQRAKERALEKIREMFLSGQLQKKIRYLSKVLAS